MTFIICMMVDLDLTLTEYEGQVQRSWVKIFAVKASIHISKGIIVRSLANCDNIV